VAGVKVSVETLVVELSLIEIKVTEDMVVLDVPLVEV
jgi:hypothetical protein